MVGKNESLFLFLCLFKELKDIMKYKWKIEKQINEYNWFELNKV